MKSLSLNSSQFQHCEKAFGRWLQTLGYSEQLVYYAPIHIREMLNWMEQHQITQLNQMDVTDIRDYYEQLRLRSNQRRDSGLSSNFLNKHQQAIKLFLSYLRNSGRLQLPYLKLRTEEKEETRIDVLTIDEVKALYQATESEPQAKHQSLIARDKALLTILYGCGLRRKEAYSLDCDDINFDRWYVHVRKGKNYTERFVPLNTTSIQHLEDYLYNWRSELLGAKENSAFILSSQGKRMDGQSMLVRLRTLIERSNLASIQQKKVTLHTLRHSIATHLLEAGMSLPRIAQFLGHRCLDSTQIYTHLAGKGGESADDIDFASSNQRRKHHNKRMKHGTGI